MVKLRHLLSTLIICSTFSIGCAFAQSSLTQIRDTVTNVDGSPFNGTVIVTWNGFLGQTGGTVSPLSTSARIYNGALSILLVPSTTASPGTFYQAAYNSNDGTVTWTEVWQVPPSNTPLTLSQVRKSTSQGSTGSSGSGTGTTSGGTTGTGTTTGSTGSGYVTLPIAIDQVTGLSSDLSSINTSLSSLTTSVNNLNSSNNSLTTTVNGIDSSLSSLTNTVNGLSSTLNVLTGMSISASFKDGEIPAGAINGTNPAFTLAAAPSPASSLTLYRNGVLQTVGTDYTLAGAVITFVAGSVPLSGDILSAYYRTPGSPATITFTDAEVPSGAINGTNLTFTLAAAPSPSSSLKLYRNGLLLQLNGDYTVSGSTITFTSTGAAPQAGDSLTAAYRH